MQVSDFHFDLPDELIARYPMAERTASRLLQLDGQSGALRHGQFVDVLDQLNPGDLLVFNNTRVIPARMFGQKASGGKLEVLVERILDEHSVLAHVRSSKSPKPGTRLILDGGPDGEKVEAEMRARHDALFEIHFLGPRPVLEILEAIGHMPLPPYIDRPDEDADKERYQTVYNQKPGAVAAPTAGLHFADIQQLLDVLHRLRDHGNTVVVIEHNLDVIKTADWLVDLGPEGGSKGGQIIAVGTPEQVSEMPQSHTGYYLKPLLARDRA